MLSSSQKSHVSRARHASHVVGSQSGRVAVLCGVLFLSGTGALIFETLWLRLSGLAFGNSVWAAALILSSFMAGLALGKCAGRVIENPAMAAAVFLRCAGGPRRIFWLHDCFWSSGRWRFDAARVANAVELSADAAGAAVRGFLPDFARADDSDGFDTAGDH